MNSKIYNGNIQPNPKEFKIWVDDEGTIRTWNGTKWVESTAGGGSEEIELITFKVYESEEIQKEYTAEKGMTWVDFAKSKYNINNWSTSELEEYVYTKYEENGFSGESDNLIYTNQLIHSATGTPIENHVRVSDFVLPNHTYGLYSDSWGVGGGGWE